MNRLVILLVCLNPAFGHPKIHPRIFGGEDASEGQFPYHVSVRYYDLALCSGSIIGPDTVLTAGRCIGRIPPVVVVGSNKVQVGWTHNVTKLYSHPGFEPEISGEYDLGIIKVSPPFTYTDTVQPIKLASTSVDDNQNVITTGFGAYKTEPPTGPSETLQFIKMKTINLQECREKMGNYPEWVADSAVCTISPANSGFCTGDYGAALVNEDGEQVGISSWNDCAIFKHPDVYTNVVSHREWIEEQMKL